MESAMHRVYLEEAKMPPLTAPKVEHATKKGISQRKEEPNSLLANVCNKKWDQLAFEMHPIKVLTEGNLWWQ